jgi:hypothetical protein
MNSWFILISLSLSLFFFSTSRCFFFDTFGGTLSQWNRDRKVEWLPFEVDFVNYLWNFLRKVRIIHPAFFFFSRSGFDLIWFDSILFLNHSKGIVDPGRLDDFKSINHFKSFV